MRVAGDAQVSSGTISANVPRTTCRCGCGRPCAGEFARGHNPRSHQEFAAPSQKAVLAAIPKNRAISRRALAENLGVPPRYIATVLTRLRQRRLIRRVTRGRWALVGVILVDASNVEPPDNRGDGICPVCRERLKAKGQGYCQPCKKAYWYRTRKPHRELTAEQKRKANCRAYSRMLERRGLLKRRPCECGSTKVQRHHFDYDDPYRVEYKCLRCHRKWHQTAEPESGVLTAAALRLLKSEGINAPTPAEISEARSRIGLARLRAQVE